MVVLTFVFLILCIVITGVLYHYYREDYKGDTCDKNVAIITINLILVLLMVICGVGSQNEYRRGLLQASVMAILIYASDDTLFPNHSSFL